MHPSTSKPTIENVNSKAQHTVNPIAELETVKQDTKSTNSNNISKDSQKKRLL